jgi:hypothetical protein
MNALWLPARSPVLRWLGILWFASALIWLSMEDRHLLTVIVLGTGGALLLVSTQTLRLIGGRALRLAVAMPAAVLYGAGVGLGTALLSALLMLLKVGMHAHAIPDYTPMQIIGVLERAPIWALAGALLAIGLLLAHLAIGSKRG